MKDKFIEYKNYLADTEKADNTIALYEREARAFENYIGKRDVSKQLVTEYKKELSKKYNKIATINAKITAVNVYLKYIRQNQCVVKTIKIPPRQCPENVLSKEEYTKMLSYALESGRRKYCLIMRVMALTGCRVSELSGLTTQALITGMYQVKNKGRIREIYIPDKLIKELNNYCRDECIEKGVIFQGRKGKPITRSAVYHMLQRIADMAGVPLEKAHPHAFRHLFALTYIDNFNNIGELADILGHSSVEITRIYISSNRRQKRERINSLDL